ncbi:hypothetical protein LI328DRAFT_136117 [Trichoderma asperelloides]|nr:hypothetical protein LI328DRAFT_136117 [Trichoderma asperelloides]
MKGQNGRRNEGNHAVSGRARGYPLTGSFFPSSFPLLTGPVFSCVVFIFISLLLSFLNHRPFGRWRFHFHPYSGILQAWRRLYSTVAVRSLILGSLASTAINTASVIDLFRYPAG